MGWFSRRTRTAAARGKQGQPPSAGAPAGRAAAGGPGGNRPAAGRGSRPPAAGPGAEPEVHRSLGLAALFAGMPARTKLEVLDLGPAVGGNIEFLSRFGCKLYIEDLYTALVGGLSSSGGERLGPAFFASFLAFPEGTRFHAVLAWDLFDYLERKELAALSSYLARYCQPEAQLLALVSIGKQIPQQPHRFKIVDAEHLAYERQSAAERPCPRNAPAELADLMHGFRLDRSFLMRHGVQEYLFARRSD
jgi:hypothetical protein